MPVSNKSSDDEVIKSKKLTRGMFSSALSAVAEDHSIYKAEAPKDRVAPKNMPIVSQASVKPSSQLSRLQSLNPKDQPTRSL